MAKDPAFLFYPGDYLRDTQMLSEKTQVAYDRIMCEHMRNICISKQQLKFLTKRLSDDEKEELNMVLTEIDGGFCIEWVAESIVKRKKYSESRRNNRKKKDPKPKKDMNNICKTYDEHMENENENENESINEYDTVNEIVYPFNDENFLKMWDNWLIYKKGEFGFKYKTIQSQQAALTKLGNMAATSQDAILIIMQSMENGWKGFFKIDEKNGRKEETPEQRSIRLAVKLEKERRANNTGY